MIGTEGAPLSRFTPDLERNLRPSQPPSHIANGSATPISQYLLRLSVISGSLLIMAKSNPYKQLRLELGFTQDEIADELKITRQHWSQLERGVTGMGLKLGLIVLSRWPKAMRKAGLTQDDFVS